MNTVRPEAIGMTALERARAAAFPAGEYVGQESFMRAGEIRALAHQAGVGRHQASSCSTCAAEWPAPVG